MKRLFQIIAALAALCLAFPAAAQDGAVVRAPAGSVRGEAAGDLHIFRGVPYARPPVGQLRWRPPLQLSRWSGTRDATQFGPNCMQPQSRPGSIYAEERPSMSEDCLTLNIWAPANAQNAPVMVWIHGGSLTTGAGSDGITDGATMARRGIVVVSINYRLGVLGYLAHPALSAESRRNISGNYGLLDQIAALEWVKRNIGAFGGDASNVTIAGESAGALSIMYLMAAPDARGLFHRAIAQSAYMVTTPALRESVDPAWPAAELVGVWLQGQLGAGDLAGLRSLNAEDITNRAVTAGFFPFGVIDGRILRRQLVDVFDRGEQAPVPMLAGFNEGEIRSLRFLLPPAPADAAAYETEIRARYGDLADSFLARYPSTAIDESMLATTRDAMYGWTAERLVVKQAAVGAPSFLYYFDHGYPAATDAGFHAFHAAEIPYIFATADRLPARWPAPPSTPQEARLSEAMMSYWVNFVRNGVPSAEGQPEWRPYGAERNYMAFEDGPILRTNVLPGAYELHEEVICRRRVQGGLSWNWNVGVVSPPLPREAPQCR